MSMSNQQAALIAASARLHGATADEVIYALANKYTGWLDRQDAARKTPFSSAVKQPQPRCAASTPGGLRCDKEEAHDGGHISTADGIGWDTAQPSPHYAFKSQPPLPTAVMHFVPSRDAHHTTCGRERNAGLYLPTTHKVRNVTCDGCKQALGL